MQLFSLKCFLPIYPNGLMARLFGFHKVSPGNLRIFVVFLPILV
jgi:hypothetical protein